jgi:hypothetical protein
MPVMEFLKWVYNIHYVFFISRAKSKQMLNILLSSNSGNKYLGAMKVYHQKTDPYGNPIITHITKGGRTMW